jgi:outer membrane lipoprotein
VTRPEVGIRLPGERRERLPALGLSVLVLALASCASARIPEEIRTPPAPSPGVAEAREDPERMIGRRVRWGGTIISVHNRERTTEIEILSRPLDRDGRPRGRENGQGRFIAEVAGFVDPISLPRDRLLTVSGRIARIATRPVGEYPYAYPVVEAASRYLWPVSPPVPPPYRYGYPWYDPWYRPWHPWYGPWYW